MLDRPVTRQSPWALKHSHFFQKNKIKIGLFCLHVSQKPCVKMWKFYFHFTYKKQKNVSIILPIYTTSHLCLGPPPNLNRSLSFHLYLLWPKLERDRNTLWLTQYIRSLITWQEEVIMEIVLPPSFMRRERHHLFEMLQLKSL